MRPGPPPNISRPFRAVFAPESVWRGLTFNQDKLIEEATAVFGNRFVNCDVPHMTIDQRGMGLYIYPPIDENDNALEPDEADDLRR